MRRSIGWILMFALAPWAGTARAQGSDKLAGTYKLVSGEKGDSKIPKDRLDGVVRITEDTMTLHDKDNNEVYVMKYTVEPAKEASRIMMTVTRSSRSDAVGMKARGLFKVKGDTLTLIYDYKGSEYPSDFDPKGDTQHLFVLERSSDK